MKSLSITLSTPICSASSASVKKRGVAPAAFRYSARANLVADVTTAHFFSVLTAAAAFLKSPSVGLVGVAGLTTVVNKSVVFLVPIVSNTVTFDPLGL